MLVITRRQDQKVLFPDLGISVTLVGARSGSAKLGVEAPREVTILREEIAESAPPRRIPKKQTNHEQHAIRNTLNSLNLYSLLYKTQLDAGQQEAAASTFMKLAGFLEEQTQAGTCEFEMTANPEAEPLRGTVMLVEDDDHQRELLTGLLEARGMQVSAFADGRSALEALQGGANPQIVLLDWAMPQFGGEWLVPAIRKNFGAKRPQLFVLSGNDKVDEQHRTSVDAWIQKPLNQDLLMSRLRHACKVAL